MFIQSMLESLEAFMNDASSSNIEIFRYVTSHPGRLSLLPSTRW